MIVSVSNNRLLLSGADTLNYVTIYVGDSLICALILCIILYHDLTKFTRQEKQNLFDQAVIMQILYLTADSFWALIDGGVIRRTSFSMGMINSIVYILSVCAAYTWYVYSESMQRNVLKPEKYRSFVFEIIGILSSLTVVFSFLLGYGYWIDEEGIFHHLPFYLAVMVVRMVVLVTASVKAFLRAGKKGNSLERQEYFLTGLYPFAYIVFGGIQLFLHRIPVLCFGAIFTMMIVYINNLYGMISADPLTQLNNRTQLQRYLSGAVRYLEEDQKLYIIMLDIDHFKTINDTYGHIEGDRALMVVASELKAACRFEKNRLFISRYGGDEFVLVTRTSQEEDIKNLIRRINLDLEDKVLTDGLRYPIHISAGYSCFQGEGDTPTACLHRADEAMYIEKKKNHVKR